MKPVYTQIFTIGYEGQDIEDFAKFLKKNKIKLLIDVRKNPVSRKRGFSKHKLAAALAEVKIDYRHFARLGVPTEWRKQAKAGFLSREKMFERYEERILPNAKEPIREVIALMQKKNVVLLCYEADHSDCHRSYLAREIRRVFRRKLSVKNLHLPLI